MAQTEKFRLTTTSSSIETHPHSTHFSQFGHPLYCMFSCCCYFCCSVDRMGSKDWRLGVVVVGQRMPAAQTRNMGQCGGASDGAQTDRVIGKFPLARQEMEFSGKFSRVLLLTPPPQTNPNIRNQCQTGSSMGVVRWLLHFLIGHNICMQ